MSLDTSPIAHPFDRTPRISAKSLVARDRRDSFEILSGIFRTSFEVSSENADVERGNNIAIAVPGDPERARAIISRGRRIARYLGLEWVAVRIVSSPTETRDALAELVDALGGFLICAEARDVAAGLIEVSRRERARVLVIGRSRRPRLLRRLKRGTTERILQAKRPFDVVVAAEGADR